MRRLFVVSMLLLALVGSVAGAALQLSDNAMAQKPPDDNGGKGDGGGTSGGGK
jgi:hypothetical protein